MQKTTEKPPPFNPKIVKPKKQQQDSKYTLKSGEILVLKPDFPTTNNQLKFEL